MLRRLGLHQPHETGRSLTGVSIGTAGWTIPAAVAAEFPGEGAHVQRYARVLSVAEINSSFHRPHRIATWQRWAGSVPPEFRFSVKLPKTITHTAKLVDAQALLDTFLAEAAGLGDTLAIVLVQLPPKLAFDAGIANAFFTALAERTTAAIACEPRHPSWFRAEADALLVEHRVARVAANPVLAPGGERPGGWQGLRYHRLHGAPRLYYSSYDEEFLGSLAAELRPGDWCIFDNTASGAATGDALALRRLLGAQSAPDR